MAKGYAIHIGVNFVNKNHYGTSGSLGSCENDAKAMRTITRALGFQNILVLTERATRKNIYSLMLSCAKKAVSGDIVMITNSSHGSFIPDLNNDEKDGRDETWCFYDAQFIDDEIYRLLCKFKKGVRIVIVTDSCHNKTIFKALGASLPIGTKTLEQDKSFEIFERNRLFYETLLHQLSQQPSLTCKASIITLSACEDYQTAITGNPLSEFTQNIVNVWNDGKFKGDYKSFLNAIAKRTTSSDRTPQISLTGVGNAQFVSQKPFAI